MDFTEELLKWYEGNARELPWIGEKNPYYIWLSEIILQQTRVEQGRPYYERFVKQYPVIEDLAGAEEDEVMKLWEGLGYYSRARNLHASAKYVAEDLGGDFPDSYEEILKLKGVGPYTAAAVASFAYNLPHAVLDGNVYRILSRYFGIDIPIDSTAGKKEFSKLASELLPEGKAAVYNQAIMDFASTQCKPGKPDCQACVLSDACAAYASGRVTELPVKEKKLKRKERFFHYLVIRYEGDVFLQKRERKDIWQNLFEFPLLELDRMIVAPAVLMKHDYCKDLLGDLDPEMMDISKVYKQLLTHQKVHACFFEMEVSDISKGFDGLKRVSVNAVKEQAFPKTLNSYLLDRGWLE